MGKTCINLELENIWKCWYLFRRGKKMTDELHTFQYNLERELCSLHEDFRNGTYRHGRYRVFTVYDPKKRHISVASLRDRVVHRMMYEFLVPVFDHSFSYDVWSCRKGKGLSGAIERVSTLRKKYPKAWIFRADVHKFFDHVNHNVLKQLLQRKISDKSTLGLLDNIIDSYSISQSVSQSVSHRHSYWQFN